MHNPTTNPPKPPPMAAIAVGTPPLNEEHLEQLRQSSRALKKVRGVVFVAKMDGGCIAIFALLTLLLGWSDLPSILIAAIMGTIAFIELRGAARLEKLDASALWMLAMNQFAFGSLLFLYGAVQLWRSLTGPSMYAEAMGNDPDIQRMLGDVEGLVRIILCVVYGAVMLVGLAGQGGMALYYLSRRKVIQQYLSSTPPWVVAVQRAVAGG